MFKKFFKNRAKKKLTDKKYEYLFDEYDGDELVCFDCETTGLNPKVDDILSISAVIIKKNSIQFSKKLDLFVKPTQKISEESIKVHRLRHCDLDNGIDIDDAIEQFLEFAGPRPLVGYYLEFDVSMVNKYIGPKLNIKLPNEQIEVSALYFDKRMKQKPQLNIDLRFETIAKELDIPIFNRHNSLNDAIMTALMYIKLTKK
jgi:DNA polymerase-3 subunit epsilon